MSDKKIPFSDKEIKEAGAQLPSLLHYHRMLEREPTNFEEVCKLERHYEWLKLALGSYFDSSGQKDLTYSWSQFFFDWLPKIYQESLQENQSSFDILAMGKLGAKELNLSSDIDLIFVGEYTKENQDHLKRFQQIIVEANSFGFLQRVDAELRPGGSYSNLIQTYSQIESYYFNEGETWERLALLRMNLLTTNSRLDKNIAYLKKNFCFRRHIDYGVFDDLSILRSKIRKEYKQKHDSDTIHVKLCPGGIRDIELFAHAFCILHGGRTPELFSFSTEGILKSLMQYSLIPKEEGNFLIGFYWDLRRLENLIQAEHDSQSHILKSSDWRIERCFGSLRIFRDKLQQCDQIVSSFIKILDLSDAIPDDIDAQKIFLLGQGFSPGAIEKHWSDLIQSTALSRKSEEDEKARKEVLNLFLKTIGEKAQDKDLSLAILKDFFKAMRAKASLFKFFKVHPQIIEDLSTIFGLSPFLSAKLCARPELIDNIVFRAQAQPPQDPEHLLEFLADHKQLAEILYGLDFARNASVDQLTKNLSATADYICRSLLAICTEDHRLNILKLGKWGGNELGLNSDLDFIFVYQGNKIPEEAHKAARRFMSLMGANYKAGRLYQIDLRLRPSGNAGPLLVSIQKLKSFLSESAELWELQAYLRASFLNGETQSLQDSVFSNPKLDGSFTSLIDIRKKLAAENNKPNRINIKYHLGGLLQMELVAQEFILKNRVLAEEFNNSHFIDLLGIKISLSNPLVKIYKELRLMEQCIQFLRQDQSIELLPGDPLYARFENFLGEKDLEQKLKSLLLNSQSILAELDKT